MEAGPLCGVEAVGTETPAQGVQERLEVGSRSEEDAGADPGRRETRPGLGEYEERGESKPGLSVCHTGQALTLPFCPLSRPHVILFSFELFHFY